jgi:hypothetical protein
MTTIRTGIAVAGLCLLWVCAGGAQEAKKGLPPKHVKAGVICHDCHRKESPSMAAVPDDSCAVCHGDYAAMVAYTKHLAPNPHNPPGGKHPGPFACTDCHHQHKPPEVKCLDCHPKFRMTPH